MEPLSVAIGNYGLTKPLKDGGVRPGDLNLKFIEVEPITAAMRRMVRGLDFDICEMAFATYLCAKALGKPVTALPVFLTRNFHHRAIFYNVKSGIKNPKDLEGRTVGVNRGYTVTTGVWARGILQKEYGVDLHSITWAPTDEEHVAEYKAPRNVDYSHRGKSAADLLLSGEFAAAVGDIRVDSPEIRPLISDAANAGYEYFRRTGIYPINHTVVLKDSMLKSQPGLARTLCDAFEAAKKVYLAHVEAAENLSPADGTAIALQKVVGDPFPFGVRANRKAIETIVQFALDQGIIPQSCGVTSSAEALFAVGTTD